MNRKPEFDVAKGIGIICVILGHCDWPVAIRIVYTFHIPLFFLISGFFLSTKTDVREYTVTRGQRLLYAYVITSSILIILSAVMSRSLSSAGDTLIRAIYGSGMDINRTIGGIKQIGAIWFLLALFWASVFVRWLIARVEKIELQISVLLVLFLVSWISSRYIWLPLSLQAGGTGALFVYIGWIAKKNQEILHRHRNALTALGVLFFLYAYLLDIRIEMAQGHFDYGLLSVFCSVMISYSVITLSRILSGNEVICKVLAFYGRNSLIFLCVHLIELTIIPSGSAKDMAFAVGLYPPLTQLSIFLYRILICTSVVYIIIWTKNHMAKKICSV